MNAIAPRARRFGWIASMGLVAPAAVAEVEGPVGEPLQVLTEPYLLGSWTRMAEIYPSRLIARGGAVRPLARADRKLTSVQYTLDGKTFTLEDYLRRNAVTSLLVVRNGRIAYEKYLRGTDANTLFVSWSMAKSVTSTLLGLLVRDGAISSLSQPAGAYVAELNESGYGDVPLRDLLQMSSGVKFVEDNFDQTSREGRAWIDGVIERRLPYNQTILWFHEKLRPPGTAFYYASIEPQVVGWVVRRRAGKPLAEYFSERIWQKLGAEHDASWVLDRPGGMEIASCCINATTRDYARFGLLFLNDGRVGDEQVVPAEWVRLATRPDPERPYLHPGAIEKRNGLGYQHYWWLWPDDDAYSALGHGGQWIYVNPRRQLVIVQTATWSPSAEGSGYPETQAVFRAIARSFD
ncbi:MAG: serine hydrolase [Steroidobacteraceae bacterium]